VLTPLAWEGPRQFGLVGGALIGAKELAEVGPTVTRGAPRSPDGKYVVAPGPTGLLVIGAKAETWTVDGAASLSDCVVSNGGAAAACVAKDRVVVFTPEAKPAAKTK
jgi:hypothetical protein